MVSVEAMEGVFERLLADEETMDVEIEMLNGEVRAHANVLSANSEAIRGILRHSALGAKSDEGIAQKRLSWREHSVEVGRFFLRLLYTGTVEDDESWASATTYQEPSAPRSGLSAPALAVRVAGFSDDLPGPTPRPGLTPAAGAVSSKERVVPLPLLLGSLAIATTYQVPHLVQAVTEALKRRIGDACFNEICATAIRLDVTALRLCCLRYAEEPPLEFKEGARVRAKHSINVDCALVKEGAMGTVSPDAARINWDCRFITRSSQVRDMIEVITNLNEPNAVHEMYTAKSLAPEVMSELAALWGCAESPSKRRRTL